MLKICEQSNSKNYIICCSILVTTQTIVMTCSEIANNSIFKSIQGLKDLPKYQQNLSVVKVIKGTLNGYETVMYMFVYCSCTLSVS